MKNSQVEIPLIPSEFSSDHLHSNCTSMNSFLIEIDHNNDISDSLRREINDRFLRSRANKNYKFPRVAQSSPLKLKASIYKFSVMKTQKKITIKKRDRSFSPYSLTLSKTKNSKSPYRNEVFSKTPLPEKAYSKLNKSTRLPKIEKSSCTMKKSLRMQVSVGKKKD